MIYILTSFAILFLFSLLFIVIIIVELGVLCLFYSFFVCVCCVVFFSLLRRSYFCLFIFFVCRWPPKRINSLTDDCVASPHSWMRMRALGFQLKYLQLWRQLLWNEFNSFKIEWNNKRNGIFFWADYCNGCGTELDSLKHWNSSMTNQW